jgi:ABC-type Fe3+-siderophore transport system permease subunit
VDHRAGEVSLTSHLPDLIEEAWHPPRLPALSARRPSGEGRRGWSSVQQPSSSRSCSGRTGLCCALVAVVVVLLIGSASRHGATPITLILAGAAVSALCAGLVSAIALFNDQALDALRFWQAGSLALRNGSLAVLWPFLVLGLVLTVLNVGPLNALSLGEDSARSLGVSLPRARATGIAAITLLAGAAVTLGDPLPSPAGWCPTSRGP